MQVSELYGNVDMGTCRRSSCNAGVERTYYLPKVSLGREAVQLTLS